MALKAQEERNRNWKNSREYFKTEIKGYVAHLLHETSYNPTTFMERFKPECLSRTGGENQPPQEMCQVVFQRFLEFWATKDLTDESNANGFAIECVGLMMPYLDALHATPLNEENQSNPDGGGNSSAPIVPPPEDGSHCIGIHCNVTIRKLIEQHKMHRFSSRGVATLPF